MESFRPFLTRISTGLASWVVVLAGLVVERGAVAIALILLARRSAVGEYGQYLATYGLASLLVLIPGLGVDNWLLSTGKSLESELIARWKGAFRQRCLLLLLWLAVMFILLMFLPSTVYPMTVYAPVVVNVVLDSLTSLSYALLRRLGRHGQVSLFQSFSSLILLGVVLAVPPTLLGLVDFALLRMGITAGAFILILILLHATSRPNLLASGHTKPRLKESRVFLWSELASMVYLKADITIVALVLGTTASGIYGSASNILQVSYLPLQALFLAVIPMLAKAFNSPARAGFLITSKRQLVAQLAMGFLLFLSLLLFAPWLVTFTFGEAYTDSAFILRLLSPIAFLRAVNFALAAPLATGNRQIERTRAQFVAALVNVLGNLAFIRIGGLPAVAGIYIISDFILASGNTLSLINLWKELAGLPEQ